MAIILLGFIVLGLSSAGVVFLVFKHIMKRENITEILAFWIISFVLTMITSAIFVKWLTSNFNISLPDK